MAAVKGMSGIDLRAVTAELSGLQPLWIDRIYQVGAGTILIRLNGEKKARYTLLIEAGRRAHLVSRMPPLPKNPPQFAMFLRKYIAGGKVLDIRQHGLERILILMIGKSQAVYHLMIELFDEGNVILADGNYTILKPLRPHRFREREVVPGAPYCMGETDPTSSVEILGALMKADERDLVHFLAVGCMLGGRYAEYICRVTALEKTLPAASVDPAPVYRTIRDLLDRVSGAPAPIISKDQCDPVELDVDPGARRFVTFSEALEAFYPTVAAGEEKVPRVRAKVERKDRILKHQQAAVKKFDQKIAELEGAVAALYENYPFVTSVIGTLDTASRDRSWQEMERLVRGSDLPDTKRIVAFYPGEAAVDLDLGRRVKVWVHEGIDQNAGRYYDLIKKVRKKKEGALRAMQAPPAEKKAATRALVPLKKAWYHRFRWFVTSDGVVVLGGRDASQNDELVKKYMEGRDLFVHADVHGASVVIVKGESGRMDEVAQFAASYSGAWRSGHFSADVYAAGPSQVSKTAEAGEFIGRGSFVVRGERRYFRDVPLSVAIGLMLDPQVAVIGGPPSAVAARTRLFVVLTPGQFEPNDVARKVLRILKQKVPPGEEKALRGILNTEQVAAFVPPGGSDIRGEHEG